MPVLTIQELMVFFSCAQNITKQCDILSSHVNRNQTKTELMYSCKLLIADSLLNLELDSLHKLNEVFNFYICNSSVKERISYAILSADSVSRYFTNNYYNNEFYENMAYFFNLLEELEEQENRNNNEVEVGDIEEIEILSQTSNQSFMTKYTDLITEGKYTL
jgi:hypothetical protein